MALVSGLWIGPRLSPPERACIASIPSTGRTYWAVLDPRRSADVWQRTQSAACLHLWNEMLRRIRIDKRVLPPWGSVLRALYESTIGLEGFALEYVLAADCADNALDLKVRPFDPSRIEGPGA
jgi:hypothetical protein